MNRLFAITVVLFLILTLPAFIALGDGIIIPDHPDHSWLTVIYHHVTVTVNDGVVITHVDQEFRNETDTSIEGRYVFPLPEGAVVSDFSMWADGKKLEGKILDADEARTIYEDYVRRALDPALLEYIGRNTIAARIFPIPAGGTRRIEITYTEVLSAESGVYRYRYPLDTERFSAAPLADVKIDVSLETSSRLQAVYSPTHKITVTKTGPGAAAVHYEESDILPMKDFILYYSVLPDEMGMTLLTYKSENDNGFFLLIVSPEVEQETTAVPKDLLFVLDTSGSMSGDKIVQAKSALEFILQNLNPDDRFAVVAFSDYPRAQSNSLLSVTPENIATATGWIRKLQADGGTNIDAALTTALGLFQRNDRPHYLVFLTDGEPTVGNMEPIDILTDAKKANVVGARIFTFGVGYDVNTFLLDRLSQENHGTTVYVTPDDNLERAISLFYRKIASPVLTSPTIEINGVKIYDAYPTPLSDIFRGSQLLYVGRYENGGKGKITLSGNVGGKTVSFSAVRSFPDVGLTADFLPRLWAGRKIAYLIDQIRLYGEKKELIDTVIELSKRYGIITPYTSFLIEEESLSADQMAQKLGQTAAAAPTSGKQAVVGASSIRTLAEEEAAPPEGESVRTIEDRTFFLKDEVWTESTYNGEETIKIKAYSRAYFDLITLKPELTAFLSLGDQLILKVGEVYIEIGPLGAETLTDELRNKIED